MALGDQLMKPYPKMGSGHAVNDTSRERQEGNDGSGVTSHVQLHALQMLALRQGEGMTSAELEDQMGIGHGMASSAFSHLHRADRVKRVKERRGRHEVYVLPEYVGDREESPYRPRPKAQRHPSEYTLEEWEAAAEAVGYGSPSSFYTEIAMTIARHLP